MVLYHVGERPENWPSWSKPIEYAFMQPKTSSTRSEVVDLSEAYKNYPFDIDGLEGNPSQVREGETGLDVDILKRNWDFLFRR